MKHSMTVLGVAAVMLASLLSGASDSLASVAGTSIWDVATVHGYNEFTISPDRSSLHYNQQGWTDYVWYENNGSISQGLYGNRTGMKTFAATDVAYGQKLGDLKISFDYKNSLGGYPSMNFFMTDGFGHFGVFSPASGGIGKVGQITTIDSDWNTMTLDMTRNDITNGGFAVYEQNGFVTPEGQPYTAMDWSVIKNYTIAGWYDYMRRPEDGWDAWGTSFDANHGLALIWGDTVNSNNSYGSQEREIRNVTVSFGDTAYAGSFVNAQVPEPATFVVWSVLGLTAVGFGFWRRKRAA